MNLPYYATYLIHQYARPLTRVDWRTCKKMEADMISALVANENRRENSEKAYLMKTYPVYRDKFIRCFTEIDNWTYYGKQRHLKHKNKYLFTNFKSVNPNHHDCLTCCLFTRVYNTHHWMNTLSYLP